MRDPTAANFFSISVHVIHTSVDEKRIGSLTINLIIVGQMIDTILV